MLERGGVKCGGNFCLIKTTQGCDYRHNFKEEYSVSQSKLLYFDENKNEILVQDCNDDISNKYLHIQTSEGCDDVLNLEQKEVFFYIRKKIIVAGENKFISSCTPKDNKVKIYEQRCQDSDNLYTHNFQSGQSFINKDFFYYKDNKRIDVKKCSPSEEVINHQKYVSDCKTINDDTKKVSYLSFKTFIEDEGSKVDITDCQQANNAIGYTVSNPIWKITQTQQNVALKETNSFRGYNKYITMGCGDSCSSFSRYYGTDSGNYSFEEYASCNHNNHQNNCYNNNYPNSWITTTGIDIDEQYSDAIPNWDIKYSMTSNCVMMNSRRQSYIDRPRKFQNFICTNHRCDQLTKLNKHLSYNRHDGSQFIDESAILDQKYVCGNGSKVINELN